MEPIAIVTAIIALLYILGRGPLLVAPAATVAAYERLFSRSELIRIFGGLMGLLAVPAIVTARSAHLAHGDITYLIEFIGWLAAAVAVWAIAAPGSIQRLVLSFWGAVRNRTLLRVIGLINVAIGLALGWVAFFVL